MLWELFPLWSVSYIFSDHHLEPEERPKIKCSTTVII